MMVIVLMVIVLTATGSMGRPAPAMATRPKSSIASRTAVTKHSVMIAGHRTSISLEAAFWSALKRCADERKVSVAGLVAEIDATRGAANLSSAIRVHLFETFRGRDH